MLSEDDLIILHVLENAANDARMGISTYGPELLRSVRLRYAKRIMDQPTERPAVITHVEEDRDLNRAITQAVDELQERAAMCEQAYSPLLGSRLHKLGCDDAHQHSAPNCCDDNCWCRQTAVSEQQKYAITVEESISAFANGLRGSPRCTETDRTWLLPQLDKWVEQIRQQPPTPDRGIVEEVAVSMNAIAGALRCSEQTTAADNLDRLTARLRSVGETPNKSD